MHPEQRRKHLKESISQLQEDLARLEEKLEARSRNLGFVGEKLRLFTWAPEVSGLTPQLFTWASDPSIEELASMLLIREKGSTAEVRLTQNSIQLSYEGGRLWLSAAQPETLLEAVYNWDLRVVADSHPFEKIEALLKGVRALREDYLLKLFPLHEVPPEETPNLKNVLPFR